MADLTKDEVPELNGLLKPPPAGQHLWEGRHQSVRVTKPVNTLQLLNEIEDRLGDREKYHVAMHLERPREEVSEDNPLTVHVHPEDADVRVINDVVEAHQPDRNYGKSEADLKREELLDRLAKGDLAMPELNQLLRDLVLPK